MRARGARGQHWYNDRRTDLAKKHARTQALWYLHLAGDWGEAFETEASSVRPHMMRCMLVTNLALDQRFANGTQGRQWNGETRDLRGGAHRFELVQDFAVPPDCFAGIPRRQKREKRFSLPILSCSFDSSRKAA